MPSARNDIIRIQKQLASTLKERIYGDVMPSSALAGSYFQAYKERFKSPFTIGSKDKLIQSILESDVVYVGDYHTLRQAQKSLQRILYAVLEKRQDIALGLEMVHSVHQPVIDRFLAGEISEAKFLRNVDYLKTWGYNWRHYRKFFQIAIVHSFPILALNSAPLPEDVEGRERRLDVRDYHAASVLTASLVRYPTRLTFVLFGDLHVVPEHLPRWVEQSLALFKQERSSLIIYQNSESVYWDLVAQGQEQQVDVVRLSAEEYCVQNTVPVAKWQSFLSWEENRRNYSLKFSTSWNEKNEWTSALTIDPDWSNVDDADGYYSNMTEQVASLVKTISKFFGIKSVDMNVLTVYTPENLNVLEELIGRGKLTKKRVKLMTRRISEHTNFYIPELSTIYLASMSLNHAAEEATKFLHHQCAPSPPTKNRRAGFYTRVLRCAFGFLGSLIINHKRMCFHDEDFRLLLDEDDEGNEVSKESLFKRKIGNYVFRHRAIEEAFLKDAKEPDAEDSIYHLSEELHIEISRTLGYSLGDLLYRGMMQGSIEKAEIRSMFFRTFDSDNAAMLIYMRLVALLSNVPLPFSSKHDRL